MFSAADIGYQNICECCCYLHMFIFNRSTVCLLFKVLPLRALSTTEKNAFKYTYITTGSTQTFFVVGGHKIIGQPR